jgi:NhaP-type Na+/H+ or K+/H+ antiporter
MVLILVILGTGMAQGLLSDIGWDEIGFTIRRDPPGSYCARFFRSSCDHKTKIGLGYFGIRGIASIFYASYLLNQVSADAAVELTRIVALVVLVSVVLYGATADYVAEHVLGHAPEEGPFKE